MLRTRTKERKPCFRPLRQLGLLCLTCVDFQRCVKNKSRYIYASCRMSFYLPHWLCSRSAPATQLPATRQRKRFRNRKESKQKKDKGREQYFTHLFFLHFIDLCACDESWCRSSPIHVHLTATSCRHRHPHRHRSDCRQVSGGGGGGVVGACDVWRLSKG